jgi:hypothetical protein
LINKINKLILAFLTLIGISGLFKAMSVTVIVKDSQDMIKTAGGGIPCPDVSGKAKQEDVEEKA